MTTFILLEGIDGCGKSSIAKCLEARAYEAGYETVEIVRDPGHSRFGEKIRDICADKTLKASPLALTLAFLAARTELAAYLNSTDVEFVILDRFDPSTIAYQCAGSGVSEGIVAAHMMEMQKLYPDMEIFGYCLMPSLELACERRASDPSRSGERYKDVDMAFKQRVYDSYKAMCCSEVLTEIPIVSTDSVEEITGRIWDHLDLVGVV